MPILRHNNLLVLTHHAFRSLVETPFRCSSFLCVGLSLSFVPTPAIAQTNDQAQFTQDDLAEVCIINPANDTPIFKTSYWRVVVDMLVQLIPDSFSLVETERCGDGVDNDCDGQIDEDCPAQDQSRWGSEQCAACLATECESSLTQCEGNERCMEAVDCMVQEECVDPFLGNAPCICGESKDLIVCQQRIINNEFPGKCANKLLSLDSQGRPVRREPSGPWDDGLVTPEAKPAVEAMACMTRACAQACADSFAE